MFGVWGLGFTVYSLGFGFRVWGCLGFRVHYHYLGFGGGFWNLKCLT